MNCSKSGCQSGWVVRVHDVTISAEVPATANTVSCRAQYAGLLSALLVLQAGGAGWAGARAGAWRGSRAQLELDEALAAREHLDALLTYFARWHRLPDRVRELIDEALADLPRNAYCAGALAMLALLLQTAALALAVYGAVRARAPRSPDKHEQRLLDADGEPRPAPGRIAPVPLPTPPTYSTALRAS